jgi:hypothetical protein
LSDMNADRPILLILAGAENSGAIESAFKYAQSTAKRLRIFQILNSELYCYGHHDLIATRHSKREFLLHIRQEVLERSQAAVRMLEEKAEQMQVSIEIESVESEDILSVSLTEAQKGCEIIFIPKQPRKIFPLFKKSLARHLRKKISGEIVSC